MEENRIIGREEEIRQLNLIMEEKGSAFVVIYGRRRVGKTFLVNQYFKNNFAFKCTGLAKKGKEDQLDNFGAALNRYAEQDCTFCTPKSWMEAFESLRQLLSSKTDRRKNVVFIDELPWMDTPKSNLVTALENFWNDWGSTRNDIVFIVCGSATSWITKKILKNKGGLHNRTDFRIYIHPFNLYETRLFLQSRGIVLSDKEIVEAYMIMGGIPFYLKQIQKGRSLSQNVDEMFFRKNGRLDGEYRELYYSLYNNPEAYLKVIEALGSKNEGLTREELLKATKLEDNGHFKEILENLDQCAIIRRYKGYGKTVKSSIFQLIDPFTLFHLRFIRKYGTSEKPFWIHQIGTRVHDTWAGLAFEEVCLLHRLQIERKLQIGGIQTEVYAWRSSDQNEKAQIDLVIKRADKVVNICEMKFYDSEFLFTKKLHDEISRKVRIFKNDCKLYNRAIHPIMVTTYAFTPNEYSQIIQDTVLMGDLFAQ